MQTIGILGGTFNPVHIGHIRPAVEVFEAVKPDRIDLVPCGSPPHKEGDNLLPFALRAEMVTAAAAPFPFLHVSQMENERPGPSYTIDTLEEYKKNNPETKLFFILGAGDLATLPTWHRGMEITNIADLVVLPRSGKDAGTFHAIVSEYWPGAELLKTKAPLAAKYGLPTEHTIHFLPQPRLDISATLVRERWLAGRNVTYLVPRAVHEIMQRERETITACWKNS